jgi:hypothetical protein
VANSSRVSEAAAKSSVQMTKVHVKAGEYVGQSLGGKRHGKGSYSVCSPEPLPSLLNPVRVTCREDPRSKTRWGGRCGARGTVSSAPPRSNAANCDINCVPRLYKRFVHGAVSTAIRRLRFLRWSTVQSTRAPVPGSVEQCVYRTTDVAGYGFAVGVRAKVRRGLARGYAERDRHRDLGRR